MKHKDDPKGEKTHEVKQDATPAIVTIDYALYEHYLESADMSEDERKEFLDTLWSIIVSFVDLGFGVHPLQQVCGESLKSTDFLLPEFTDVVEQKEKIHNTNSECKTRCDGEVIEGSQVCARLKHIQKIRRH